MQNGCFLQSSLRLFLICHRNVIYIPCVLLASETLSKPLRALEGKIGVAPTNNGFADRFPTDENLTHITLLKLASLMITTVQT